MALVQLASLASGNVITQVGSAIAGASVNVYVHGTTIPATVYADATRTTTLTLPLATDVRGEIPGYVDEGQTLDFVVTYHGVTYPAVEVDVVRGDRYRDDKPSVSGWRTGRQLFTNFTDATSDALRWDISGQNYITDSSRTAIQPTADGTQAIVTSKEKFRNCEIRMRYRFPTSSPHTSSKVQLLFRVSDNPGFRNYVEVDKQMNPAIYGVSAVAITNTTSGSAIGDPGASTRDQDLSSTTPRILRARVIEGNVFVKSWLEGSAEPDWQLVGALTHNSGIPQLGAAGVLVKGFNSPNNPIVYEVAVSELVRTGDNVLYNPDGVYVPAPPIANTDMVLPLGWTKPDGAADPSGGNKIDMVSDVDPWGSSRPVFRVKQATNVGAGGGGFYQALGDVGHLGNTSFGTIFPANNVDFDRGTFEFSVWSKGIAIDPNPAATVGSAVMVFYIYDINNNILQGLNDGGSPDVTFIPLGPNKTRGVTGGTGTWDWYKTKTRIRFPRSVAGRVYQVSLRMIYHDGTGPLGGEFRFCDPRIRVVA